MLKIDLRSQIILTVVGLLVTGALIFVGTTFLGMQEDIKILIKDLSDLQVSYDLYVKVSGKDFERYNFKLSEVNNDLKKDILTLKSDLLREMDKLWGQ